MSECFDSRPRAIAVLGIGEAAGAFLEGWDRHGCERLSAFDIKSNEPATRGWVEERCRHLAVVSCPSAAEALGGAQLVLSLVTADEALNAAAAAAPYLTPVPSISTATPAARRRSARPLPAWKPPAAAMSTWRSWPRSAREGT